MRNRSSGGGAELASKVPADAVAYAELNLDPPAGQKVAVVRFLRHFPDARIGGESGSLLDSVIEPLIQDPEVRRQFVEDVKPWLGRHVAVAGDPQQGAVRVIGLLETTDAGRARAGLDRLNAAQRRERDRVHYTIAGDVVYVAETQAMVDTAARDAGDRALTASTAFTGDVAQVGGDDGVVTFWSDLGAAARYDTRPGPAATAQGRVAGRLTFTDTTGDLVVKGFGNPARPGTETVGPRLRTLPADTAGAAALSGGDELVRTAYDQLEKAGLGKGLARAEREIGLRAPPAGRRLILRTLSCYRATTADTITAWTLSDPESCWRCCCWRAGAAGRSAGGWRSRRRPGGSPAGSGCR